MKKLTAIEAIRLTVEQRELMAEGYSRGKAADVVCRGHNLPNTTTDSCCFLCISSIQRRFQRRFYYKYPCNQCPIKIITGRHCSEHDVNFHYDKLMEGLSFALALQYYWEKRYCHGGKSGSKLHFGQEVKP